MLCLCRFIEYGEYKDNLYGTSLESIHRILDQNKVCLVDVQPEVSITLILQHYRVNSFTIYIEYSNHRFKSINVQELCD